MKTWTLDAGQWVWEFRNGEGKSEKEDLHSA